MPSNDTYACFKCRIARKATGYDLPTCTQCGTQMHNMGKHWRAPRKNNVKAWKRVARGEKFWEDSYTSTRYRRVYSRFRKSGYAYLTLAIRRQKGGSTLDSEATLREPDPRRGRQL